MIFHRNDSDDKVANYCTVARVHFEYTYFWDKDEEVFQNAQNMTNLRRRFKQKIIIVGGKGNLLSKLKIKKKRLQRKGKKRHIDWLEKQKSSSKLKKKKKRNHQKRLRRKQKKQRREKRKKKSREGRKKVRD